MDDRRKNLKNFSDAVILGSSPSNSYFRNMITFLPRIFFISDEKVNLAIHRNTSNKFRFFIKEILNRRIPHILGSYIVAATSLVLFID